MNDIVLDFARKIRNKPVSAGFLRSLKTALEATDPRVGARIVSGGQPPKGKGGRRTGSTRHDVDSTGHAHAGDLVLTIDGRDVRPGENKALYARFLSNAAPFFPGIGHYPWGVHVGAGKTAAWGPTLSKRSLDPVFGRAIRSGRTGRKPKEIAEGAVPQATALLAPGSVLPRPKPNKRGIKPLEAAQPPISVVQFANNAERDLAVATPVIEPAGGGAPGNAPIDLSRPRLSNPDGSFSTERTITIDQETPQGRRWFNIPTIVNGQELSEEQATALFRSGQNPAVGEFNTLDEALQSAQARSNRIGELRTAPSGVDQTQFGVDPAPAFDPAAFGAVLVEDPAPVDATPATAEVGDGTAPAAPISGPGAVPVVEATATPNAAVTTGTTPFDPTAFGAIPVDEPVLGPTIPVNPPPDPTALGGQENVISQGLSGINEILTSMLGLPVDAATAVINFAAEKATGERLIPEGNIGSGQQLTQALTQAGGIVPESEDPTNQFARRVGQEIGATIPIATGIGALGTAGVTASRIPVVREALAAAARTPGRFAATEAGLATTSGVGAATAQQLAPDNLTAEFIGQLAGGLAPGIAVSAARSAIPGRANIPQNVRNFETAGATPSLGQATENPIIQAIETTIGTVPGGRGRFVQVATDTQEKIGRRIDQMVKGLTTKADPTRAGKVIKQGIIGQGGFIGRFREASTKLFDAVPIQPDQPVGVSNTQKFLADTTAPVPGLEQTSQQLVSPQIRQIASSFIEDVQATGLAPFAALKSLRTKVGELAFSTDLIADVPRAQLQRLYGAISDDLKAAADAAGPEARRSFERANKFYRENIQVIDDVLNKITNKVDPEEVFTFATRGKEGASRIGAIRNSLKPNEWNVVAGTVLKRLGKAIPSSQDDIGEVFSAETFLSNWNKLPRESKNALFSGKRFGSLRLDLDAIAATADRIRKGSRVLFNPSGTANRLANILPGAAAVGGGVTGSVPVVLAALSAPAFANGAARLMTNPKFIKWLAKANSISPARLPGHIARLSNTFANDAGALEDVSQFIGVLQDPANQVTQDQSR